MSDSPASAYTADLRSRPTTPLLDRRAAKVAYFDQLTMSRIDFDEYYSPAGIVVDRLGGTRGPAADEEGL